MMDLHVIPEVLEEKIDVNASVQMGFILGLYYIVVELSHLCLDPLHFHECFIASKNLLIVGE